MSKLNLIHSNPIESHKSVFIGHACKLNEVSEFKKIKDLLLEDKKVAKATHNIWAYRIVNEKGNVVSDCDDDGETGAGSGVLRILDLRKATNVVVFVSRWYGGVHLGNDRFKLVNRAAMDALELGNFLPGTNDKNSKDSEDKSGSKNKKKNKKK
ncbi:UPF0029-domain-containing protein [Conidiobolus coronatus NRRL 28638]|uniref:UPF0029-domain-containing protein n=1 Tax=Conidiobolus coronatus (strain ATCC 28846 / CBS 209.66 / NRRL 28638) TaxID=796925 RepID=A0A137P0S3_CONC2|nr:UPF0029-domain-containing protein [Conidiobolus coronatus NRRL 28638]|eukprot:KXN68655.1 UPF0029-domain-containing protein [Conidiobolus coronatus NRRL 28638]